MFHECDQPLLCLHILGNNPKALLSLIGGLVSFHAVKWHLSFNAELLNKSRVIMIMLKILKHSIYCEGLASRVVAAPPTETETHNNNNYGTCTSVIFRVPTCFVLQEGGIMGISFHIGVQQN